MKHFLIHNASALEQNMVPRSKSYRGRFGRLFGDSYLKTWTDDQYKALARKMIAGGEDVDNRSITAGYTYFGQFLNHDITFNPISDLTKQVDPEGIHNFRTPRFDLDSIYGRGPVDQPYLYAEDGIKFHIEKVALSRSRGSEALLGEEYKKYLKAYEYDLPRIHRFDDETKTYFRSRAIIADPRNDENVIVSQLHLAFLKFHNQTVDRLKKRGTHKAVLFQEAQRITIWHYQHLVLKDYLPKIVDQAVLEKIREEGPQDYEWEISPFIPVEFAVAAFRFGHTMVRPNYFLNSDGTIGNPISIFLKGKNPNSLVGFRQRKLKWTIEWARFFGDGVDVQFSKKINTKLASGLASLPEESLGDSPSVTSLAERNLLRGKTLKLPSGQAVAKAMGVNEGKILKVGSAELTDVTEAAPGLETPLWYYILSEAKVHGQEKRLGPVGSRIVAEVLTGLFQGDPNSYHKPNSSWEPNEDIFSDCFKGDFTVADFLRIAEGECPDVQIA